MYILQGARRKCLTEGQRICLSSQPCYSWCLCSLMTVLSIVSIENTVSHKTVLVIWPADLHHLLHLAVVTRSIGFRFSLLWWTTSCPICFFESNIYFILLTFAKKFLPFQLGESLSKDHQSWCSHMLTG